MEPNRRILVVDDQEDLRMQVAKILQPKSGVGSTSSLIDQIRSRISKTRPVKSQSPSEIVYEVDTVGQGRDAYEKVKESFNQHQPYAVMFLDMRMPPGWDGLETAQRIRSIDKEIQIVIMTAYADHDQREIAEKIGEPDKLLYIKKPFHPEEIRQLAMALTEKWNMNRREKERLILTNRLMRESSFLTRHQFKNIQEIYRNVLEAFVSFLDAKDGILVQQTLEQPIICASVTPRSQALLEKVRGSGIASSRKCVCEDENGILYYPIQFDGFDGYLYIEGKGLVFPFEQIRSYLDILMETSREVMINAFLQHKYTIEKQLASVGQATERIAQHFGTIIQKIQEHVKKLSSADTPPARQEVQLLIQKETADMLTYIKELTSFSTLHKQTLHCEKYLISNLVKDALQRLEDKIQSGSVQIQVNSTEDISIICDKEKVIIALIHLIDNALNAVILNRPENDRWVHIEISYLNSFRNAVNIVIEDNGKGIPPTVENRVFEPFVTSDPQHHNGIGATIAKQIVEKHGGMISYVSNSNIGTTFQVVLPISPEIPIANSSVEKV